MYIIQVIFIFLGLIGNVISFIIFSRKTFQNNSISTYCQSLAIFDSLILTVLIQNIGEEFFHFAILNQSDVICKIYNYIFCLFSSIPAWILVAFSMDKMLIMRKHAFLILRKKWFQCLIVAVITITNSLLFLGVPINLVPNKKLYFYFDTYYCDISSLDFFTVFIIGYLIETVIIPFVIMFITSIVTIRLLVKSRNNLEANRGGVDRQRKMRDSKFAISSLTFNLMFILFKSPISVIYCLIAYNVNVDLFFYQTAMFMFFLNASSNFYIHFATNSIFRREFCVIFRLKRQQRYIDRQQSANNSIKSISYRVKPRLRVF